MDQWQEAIVGSVNLASNCDHNEALLGDLLCPPPDFKPFRVAIGRFICRCRNFVQSRCYRYRKCLTIESHN